MKQKVRRGLVSCSYPQTTRVYYRKTQDRSHATITMLTFPVEASFPLPPIDYLTLIPTIHSTSPSPNFSPCPSDFVSILVKLSGPLLGSLSSISCEQLAGSLCRLRCNLVTQKGFYHQIPLARSRLRLMSLLMQHSG